MRPDTITIHQMDDPAQLATLEADAKADGRRMVSRLTTDWTDGTNRFDKHGEKVYLAIVGGEVCGVCGLNADPFAYEASIGRVRRLYVAVAYRRRGVASAILSHLVQDAVSCFRVLRTYTDSAEAAAFYEASGFEPVTGIPKCTHGRSLVA